MKHSLTMSHCKKMSTEKPCLLFLVIIATTIFSSCQKEIISSAALDSATLSSSKTIGSAFHIDAGPEKIVVSPSSTSTTLTGSASGTEGPYAFKWTQVNGDSSVTIAQPTSNITTVRDLK